MRVLMVTPRFLPDTGGVETHVAEVSRRVAAGGHRVRVLTTDLSGRRPAAEVVDDVEVRRVRAWPRGADYYFAPDLYPAVSKGDWDVVHVQSYHTLVAPLAMAGSLSASIPYVLTFHGGGHSSRVRNALRTPQLLLLRPLLVRAAGLVAVAAFEIDDYASRLRIARDRFTLVPNGADLPVLRAQGLENAGAGLLIASVGRLERYKGHQHVLAAFPHVLRERPEARLWIAGTGTYERKLRALSERLGVKEKVDIRAVPAEDRVQMSERLSEAAVVVLASEYETHPIAAIEAAALGRPLVVSDTSGLRELADRGLARAVANVGDPESLARALLDEIAAPTTAGRLELPTWDDCARDLCALYEQVRHRAS